ncbi:MAG: GHMP kinase, partial [Eudoraea sp.]|nr:GHMP kinase [Eudoraea sp.]
LLYRLDNTIPRVQEISFDPGFKQQIYFVYLNEKKDSREGISQYRERQFDRAELVDQLSEITKNMTNCKELEEFESLMARHELLLSVVLGMPTVKSALFSDYPAAIKSLGAWGGDFVMATGDEDTPVYFRSKGYKVVIPYEKMVLS